MHEAANQAADFVGLGVKLIKTDLRDVALVQGDIEVGFNLTARDFGVGEELNKLTVATSFEAIVDTVARCI
jgi:hypothetical protein